MLVRLDIWHFMRQFASACSTESHPLYAVFLTSLSRCIFVWNASDVASLMEAKRADLSGGSCMSDDDAHRLLTRDELARHCRRRTRGVEEMTLHLERLVQLFESDKGKDVLGVPLFPKGALHRVWDKQRMHIPCIQDPAPSIVNLYQKEKHETKKGGMSLPVYKCTRGSTSLEGFHNHLARFIPGIIFYL
jgi:hypothetical protein